MRKYLHSGLIPNMSLKCVSHPALFSLIFLLFFVFKSSAFAQEVAPLDKLDGDYTKKELRLGERLFRGLAPFESGLHNCASCHYVATPENINWNPSAYDMANVWLNSPSYDLKNIMNLPMTARLMKDHSGMTITDEEVRMIEAYYVKLIHNGRGGIKNTPVNTAVFWLFAVLMTLAIIDLLFTKKIKYHFIHGIILLAGLGIHSNYIYAAAVNIGRTPDYAPDQPIKFSHKIHAGDNKIDCLYCHHIAEDSKSGGIPSNNVCLNCHNVVRNGTLSGSFEINKIHRAAETGEPVKWIRVHNLPDHSFFSHSQHVNAGKLDCTECHGEVETMHIVKQVEQLSMGWCLDCHRTRAVDFTDNPYYEIYGKLHEQLKEGLIDSVTVAKIGGENCMKCHY
jgi:hypothetical protein